MTIYFELKKLNWYNNKNTHQNYKLPTNCLQMGYILLE